MVTYQALQLSETAADPSSLLFVGYIAERLGWRWALWIPGIMQAGLLVIVLLTLPETLFSRRDHTTLERKSYAQKMLFHGKVLDRKIQFRDFIGSLRMAKYAAVFFPAVSKLMRKRVTRNTW